MLHIPKFGEKSQSVKLLQLALNKKTKDMKLKLKPLRVDGDFGPMTKKAASVFQKAVGLRGSGILGPRTIAYLELTEKLTFKESKEKYPNKEIIKIAYKYRGVKEVPGKKEHKDIRMFHRYSTVNNDKEMSEDVPWCSSFVCAVVEKAGLKSTNNKMARSWERGKYKKVTSKPMPGDVLTMWRKSKKSGFGHVGIYLGETASYYYVLGGNKSDAVNIKKFKKSEKITGIWRVHDQKLSSAQERELISIAQKMIAGSEVSIGGKVI